MLQIVFGVLAIAAGEPGAALSSEPPSWSAARARARAASVQAQLVALAGGGVFQLSPETAAMEQHRAELTCPGDGTVDVVLRRSNGERIADRELAVQASCGDSASAIAVIIGAWRPTSIPRRRVRLRCRRRRSRQPHRRGRRRVPCGRAEETGRRPGHRPRTAKHAAIFVRRRPAGGADRRAGTPGATVQATCFLRRPPGPAGPVTATTSRIRRSVRCPRRPVVAGDAEVGARRQVQPGCHAHRPASAGGRGGPHHRWPGIPAPSSASSLQLGGAAALRTAWAGRRRSGSARRF